MTTITVEPGAARTTNPFVPDNNTYVVEPGSTLTVAGGLGPRSAIIDVGGTVLFETPPDRLDQGIVTLVDGGFLVFAGMQFIGPATVPPDGGGERIRLDETAVIGIANAPSAPPSLTWVTNLDGFYPPDPSAGSFNLTFGTEHFGLDVGLIFPPPPVLSKPPWSVSQPIPGADIIRATDMVAMGIPMTANT